MKAEDQNLRLITCRVDRDLWDKFQEKAKKTGLSSTQILRKLMEDYVKDRQIKLDF